MEQGDKLDPVSCGIQTFLDFLADLYGQGLQYRTINAIRSAVSTTHNTIENTPIGQHPLVSRLMKGTYNSRPPEPQYSNTWDVTAVLTWLKGQGSQDSELSLKDLSGKLALLIALVSANRTSELHALDLRFRSYTPDGVLFRLASLSIKRKVGAALKDCFFASFPQDRRLCVVQCLCKYEEGTEKYRDIQANKPAPLFLSYVKPHKPVSS